MFADQIERAHFVAYQAAGDPPVHSREVRVARHRRHMWAISPLLRPHRRVTSKANGAGDSCRDSTALMQQQAQTLPPVHVLAYNRLRLMLAWVLFVVVSLRRGKVPIGPGSHTIAVPSKGLAGPWQRASPLAFGCVMGPHGMGVSCLLPIPRPSPTLRPLLARAAACAPRPTARERVSISASGWVMRPRNEADLCPDLAIG